MPPAAGSVYYPPMGANETAANARAAWWEWGAVTLLLFYFAGRVVFFAFNLDPAVPPDEITHMGRIAVFATTWGIPDDTAALAATGFVPSEPYLYYWLAARLVHLNPGLTSDLVFLRLVSGLLGLMTVVYGWRWVRLFARHPLARVLFVVLLTNTLMFTVVCATVSYDALLNLCAAATVYHLTRYRMQPGTRHLLATLLFLAVGGLTKLTMLPLALAVIICILFGARRHYTQSQESGLERNRGHGEWALAAVVLVAFALNAYLYGGNLLHYGKPVPEPAQVYNQETILTSAIWARNTITQRFRDGELTLLEALALAENIPHPAARRDTKDLLIAAESNRREGVVFRPMPAYLYAFIWVQMIGERTFGILAHQIALKQGVQLLPYLAIGLVALYQFFMQWRPLRQKRFENDMIFIAITYALVVMVFVNYRAYVNTEQIVMTVQGRYLFPVIVPFYGLVARYYLDDWPAAVRWMLFALAALVFILGDLPHFLLVAESDIFFGDP